MKTFVIGDIHGAYRAMLQVLERANFNPQTDTLVGIGDYVDGWPESMQVVDWLMKLPAFLGVMGNHDEWAWKWLLDGPMPHIWTSQGGKATVSSYAGASDDLKHAHGEFLRNIPAYRIIGDNYAAIMHGGCVAEFYLPVLHLMPPETLMWDRDLYYSFKAYKCAGKEFSITPFNNVFIGHTQTGNQSAGFEPFEHCGLYNLDQGAGWDGVLTVMDLYTKEWWQSDRVSTLYQEVGGRK